MVRRLLFPCVGTLLLGLFAGTSPAFARGSGMDFGPPPGQAPTTPPRTTPAPAPVPAPEDDPYRADVEGLAQWPDRAGVRAAESLLLRGAEVLPRLLEILNGEESAAQPGAAWVIGRLGEPAHIQIILRTAARRENGSRAEDFFEAAWALDPAKTKEWLFSFLTLNRPVFRQKATEFLVTHVDASDAPRVLLLLDADKPGVRIAGLRLLGPAGVQDATPRLVQALSDLDPDVSRRASVLLALHADDAVIHQLNELAVEGMPRERAYAALALVEVARTRDMNPFEPKTLSELAGRRGLLHPERLPRGAAAVALAYGAGDAADESVRALLDRTVVDVLVDTIGGSHFRDFSSLADPVFAALRRLSGVDLPATAVAWATWWRGERDHFQARRPLASISEHDLPISRVLLETVDEDGRRRHYAFRPEDGTISDGDIVLKRSVYLALVQAIQEAGIFTAEAVTKPSADEHLLISLGVGNQLRRMLVPASDARYALLRLRFDSLAEANRWQRYRDTDQWPDPHAWWTTNVGIFEQADPSDRRQLLRASVVASFDDLAGDAERAEALDLLEDLQAEDPQAGTLTTSETRDLVVAATSMPAFGQVEDRAVRFALAEPAAGPVRHQLAEALAVRSEPAAAKLLANLLAAGGVAEIKDAFADTRAPMRTAAARAAWTLVEATRAKDPSGLAAIGDALSPGLEVLEGDADRHVAVEAAVGLHHLGDENAMATLEKIYKEGDASVRLAVAEGLGDVRADDAYPLLNLMLAEERGPAKAPLRAAALASIAKTGHKNAVNLLTFYLLKDDDAAVEKAAGDALAGLGTEEARYGVVRALTEGQSDAARRERLVQVLGRFDGAVVREVLTSYLEDKDPRVSSAAALALAGQNLGTSVPYLIAVVRGADSDRAEDAIHALEDVTLVRFQMASHALVAEQYESWYASARIQAGKEPDRTWFRDALRRRGYEAGPLEPYVKGGSDPSAVPLLVRALRDDDALIRRGAAVALRRITGLDFGEVGRTTSQRDAIRVADRWARWWSRVGGGEAPGR